MASSPNPVCPKCKQSDQVQQVKRVYDSNTKEWVEEEYNTDIRGRIDDRYIQHESHTRLGLMLKPPEEPESPRNPRLWYIVVISILVIILLSLCPFVVFPLALVMLIGLANTSTLPEVFRSQIGTTTTVVIVSFIFIVALILVGILAWVGWMIKRRYDRSMADYRVKEEAYKQDQLRLYQRAKECWEHLYYCSRDSIVFLPAENVSVPIENMNKYINEPYHKF